jgi:hypothetical protein
MLGWLVGCVQPETTIISCTVVIPAGLPLSVAANVTLNVPSNVGVKWILISVTPRAELETDVLRPGGTLDTATVTVWLGSGLTKVAGGERVRYVSKVITPFPGKPEAIGGCSRCQR